MVLSIEQCKFVEKALEGKNILVDACIGSGKTTAIQHLCDKLPADKKILYLTYNKLLKLDAKKKIGNKNATVQNYHGFALYILNQAGIKNTGGVSDFIQTVINQKPPIPHYDILIIDEYQDINSEIAYMLDYIKESNPNIQIIAVGDMAQKIYDNTTLEVLPYIKRFLDEYALMEFTQCFRLSKDLAEKLGRIWEKNISGVNINCVVRDMSFDEVIEYLSTKNVEDILCLGQSCCDRQGRASDRNRIQNEIERRYPEKFNKKTLYAKINNKESEGGVDISKNNCAIFTTYDGSKGLERKVCVVCDFTEDYWRTRIEKPQTKYYILRNIFCVAASRGKEEIIFVRNHNKKLSEKTLSTQTETAKKFKNVNISEMFDFKFKEDIEKAFSLLKIEYINKPEEVIDINLYDELIDLSPCIGIYQEAMFFKKYNINSEIELVRSLDKSKRLKVDKRWPLEKKILYLVAYAVKQDRYAHQVIPPFINDEQKADITKRIESRLSPNEDVQKECSIRFYDSHGTVAFTAKGQCDVLKDKSVYELKFVSKLSHENFLQCACYMLALNLKKGYLWNIKNNELYLITISKKKTFLDAITKAITKGELSKYYSN